MSKLKIGILGTRGIPNNHGGFEQLAEYLSVYLVDKGHEVIVYNSHKHPYQDNLWNGVQLVHCYDLEHKIGTAGQFIYDLNCIRDSRKRDFDVLLQLGYTSSSIWYKLLPKKAIILTNMDGLEWKRTKYSKPVRRFLKTAEKFAAISSDFLISDSIAIKSYIKEKYNRDSEFIAYGANLFVSEKENVLLEYKVEKHKYNMLIARLEPENNIAHDNDFNKSILGKDAFYFLNSDDVKLQLTKSKANYSEVVQANLNKIENEFSWPIINGQYEDYMSLLVRNKNI